MVVCYGVQMGTDQLCNGIVGRSSDAGQTVLFLMSRRPLAGLIWMRTFNCVDEPVAAVEGVVTPSSDWNLRDTNPLV
jgi:hypothetical protein